MDVLNSDIQWLNNCYRNKRTKGLNGTRKCDHKARNLKNYKKELLFSKKNDCCSAFRETKMFFLLNVSLFLSLCHLNVTISLFLGNINVLINHTTKILFNTIKYAIYIKPFLTNKIRNLLLLRIMLMTFTIK